MVIIIASEGYDTFRAAHTGDNKINHCGALHNCIKWWNQSNSDELQDFYNNVMSDFINNLDSKQIYFYKNSIKTSRTPDKKYFLHADGTHKLLHKCGPCHCRDNQYGKDCIFKLPDSLVADTDMFLNLFCNDKLLYDLPKNERLCCK